MRLTDLFSVLAKDRDSPMWFAIFWFPFCSFLFSNHMMWWHDLSVLMLNPDIIYVYRMYMSDVVNDENTD